MGVLHRQLGEYNTDGDKSAEIGCHLEQRSAVHVPVPKTIRKLFDRRCLVRTRKTKPTKLGTPCLNVLVWVFLMEQALKVFDRSGIVWKLVCRVLGVFSYLELHMLGNGALARFKCAHDQVEQGALAGSVCAHYGNPRIHARNEVRFFVENGLGMTYSIPKERCSYRYSSFLPE
jgi:hypothetical protein